VDFLTELLSCEGTRATNTTIALISGTIFEGIFCGVCRILTVFLAEEEHIQSDIFTLTNKISLRRTFTPLLYRDLCAMGFHLLA
jgi:hypothetical protein